jgi:hypothetical protein
LAEQAGSEEENAQSAGSLQKTAISKKTAATHEKTALNLTCNYQNLSLLNKRITTLHANLCKRTTNRGV